MKKPNLIFFYKISKKYTYLIHKNKIIIHFKKNKTIFFLKKKLPEEVVLPETFRKKWLFRKVLPEYSKGIRKNPSSENFLEELLLPEVLEEAFAVLPEDATVTTPFSIFSGVFYPKVPLS